MSETTFKQLRIGQVFEFDHSDIVVWGGANGPWIKVSPRGYREYTTPFSLDQSERAQHAQQAFLPMNTVGSIKVKVNPIAIIP